MHTALRGGGMSDGNNVSVVKEARRGVEDRAPAETRSPTPLAASPGENQPALRPIQW